MSYVWNTKLSKLIPSCRVPIVAAPMLGVSGGKLAYEVCRAGGLGMLAGGHLTTEKAYQALQEEIQKFRPDKQEVHHNDYPLSIGIIAHSTFGCDLGWKLYERLLQEYSPNVIQLFAPAVPVKDNNDNGQKLSAIEIAKSYGSIVFAQVGTVAEAQVAIEAGVDGLIAQGSEAGGHGVSRSDGNGTLSLSTRLVQMTDKPVLAAGGISSGQAMVAALALGCDGVVVGTRFWASHESIGRESYKHLLASPDTNCDDVIRTRVFDTIWNSYRSIQWPLPYNTCGALKNDTTNAWDNKQQDLEQSLANANSNDECSLNISQHFQQHNGDATVDAVLCGEGIGEIQSIQAAYDIVQQMEKEAIIVLTTRLSNLFTKSEK